MKAFLPFFVFVLLSIFLHAQQSPPKELPVAGSKNELIFLNKTPHAERTVFTTANERIVVVENDSVQTTKENRRPVSGEKDEYLPAQKSLPAKKDE